MSLYTGPLCPLMTSLSRYKVKVAFSISISSSIFIFLQFSRCMDLVSSIVFISRPSLMAQSENLDFPSAQIFSFVFYTLKKKNHRKINIFEEIEILKAASSRYQLNDIINGQSDPVYRLIPSVSDLNFKSQQPRLGDRRNFLTTNQTCYKV